MKIVIRANKIKPKVKMKVALIKKVLKTKTISMNLKNKKVKSKNNKANQKLQSSSPTASIH
jgi:hypothetical protein